MHKPGMKEISVIVSVIAFTILIIAVIIILNFTKGDVRVNVLEKQTRVGLMLDCGSDDSGWGQSHSEALSRISGELNLEIVCRDNVAADESCMDVIRELIDDDCLVIVAASLAFGDYISRAAQEYPDRYFLHAEGTVSGRNIGSYLGRMYQLRYLSGMIAGTQTDSGHIGYVASVPVPEVNRGVNAFALGVRKVNPDAVVHVSFCGTWNDDRSAYEATERLIGGYGADVIAMHVNTTAPLDAAEKNGVWSIGCNYDNSGLYPDSCLTSCVWKWDNYYKDQILSCIQGKFRGEHSWLGTDSGIMELVDPAVTGNARPGYEESLSAAQDSFNDRSFDVFYGPITDNSGNIRVAADESMSDEQMLGYFDWYVEGVKVEDRS